MKLLSIDPGSTRLGYALLEGEQGNPPEYVDSGYASFPRVDQKYQEYRLALIRHWVMVSAAIFGEYEPEEVCSEIVPVVGGGNFVAATVSQLAATAVTTIQAMATNRDIPITQVGATTVKAKVGGHKESTKVRVRNGVIAAFPELAGRKSGWTKIFEEPDAIAVGLTRLWAWGCSHGE